MRRLHRTILYHYELLADPTYTESDRIGMSICYVLEGGAMRGNFSGGVLDYLVEHGFPRGDCLVGTSAGGICGINYASRQPGRAVRINTTYCTNWRFLSIKSLLATGNAFGTDFYFNKITREYDPLDMEMLEQDPFRFVVCATNLKTAEPVYHEVRSYDDLVYLQASSAMPLVSRIVKADGLDMLDGAIADSIPFQWALDQGFDKVIVILTRDRSYVKTPQSAMSYVRRKYRNYPAFVDAIANRHLTYNAQRERAFQLEAEGRIKVLAPENPVTIGRMEHDPAKIVALYNEGRDVAAAAFAELLEYVES